MNMSMGITTLTDAPQLPENWRALKEESPMNRVTCCDFDDFVKAMADGTRQCILSLLQGGAMNESEIVARMDLTQPTISHHLAVLQHANLVSARRDGKHVVYHSSPACIAECCSEILNRFKISPETKREAFGHASAMAKRHG